MSTHQSESAGPALRGFRLQLLYTLARLTELRTTLQATLWPEGVEDLAIFDDRGVLREAIQIKAHTAPLTLSELVSRRGNGLMQRAVETARTHPECRVRLLSFGPFGQELQDAWEGARAARDRVTRKLKDAGLSPTDVAILFDRLTLERLDEAAEQAKVDGFLGAVPALAGQSSHAAAILCQWLYAFDAMLEFTRNDRCQGILARGRTHQDADQALVLRPRPGERRWPRWRGPTRVSRPPSDHRPFHGRRDHRARPQEGGPALCYS